MASKIQRELAFLLTGKDVSASRAMQNVDRKISGLERHAGKAARNIGSNIERGFVIGGTAAVGAIAYSVKAATDWESAFTGVRKTLDATPVQLKAVEEGIRAMSREMPVAATDLAAIAEAGGQMGVGANDILEFTRVVALIGTTTNVSTDDAATALGQLQNVIGLTAADFDNFAATLVDLGNKGSSTESQILEVARRSGGAAHLIGIAKDETVGWAAAAANLGLNQELAGTALQSFYLKSQQAVRSVGGLKEMAKTAGVSAATFKKRFGKDATGALELFLKGLGKLPKGKRLDVVQDLFGKTSGLTRLIVGLSQSVESNLVPSLDTSKNAWDENTAATAEYEKRAATTASSIQILQNNIQDAAVTIGSELLPQLADLSKEGTAWIQDHQPEIKAFAKDLAGGIRDAVTWAKSLDWDAIGAALRAGADAAKTIVDTFMGLPAPIQQLLVGGFVANKVTGGVLTDVASGVVGGAFKAVLTRMAIQAAVVNVTGGTVNGGGGLTGGGGGLTGGGGGGKGGVIKGALGGLVRGAGFAIGSDVVLNSSGADGAGGVLGNVAGGAVAGASIAGPLGAVVGAGLGGIKAAIEHESAMNSAIGDGLKGTLATNLPKMGTAELQTSLAAVNTGIREITSNPLNVLVQGSALDSLQAMQTKLVGQVQGDEVQRHARDEHADAFGAKPIGDVQKAVIAGVGPSGSATVAFRAAERASETGLRDVSGVTRSGTSGTTGAVNTSASRIVAAVGAARPVVTTNVQVNVTPGAIQKATNTQTHYGKPNGSAGGGNAHGGGGNIDG